MLGELLVLVLNTPYRSLGSKVEGIGNCLCFYYINFYSCTRYQLLLCADDFYFLFMNSSVSVINFGLIVFLHVFIRLMINVLKIKHQ